MCLRWRSASVSASAWTKARTRARSLFRPAEPSTLSCPVKGRVVRIELAHDPAAERSLEMPVVTLRVAEDSHPFTTRDGTKLHRFGYAALDEGGRFLRQGDRLLAGGRCLACNVAGTSHRRAALERSCFA